MPIEFECRKCECIGLEDQLIQRFSFLRFRKVNCCPCCKSNDVFVLSELNDTVDNQIVNRKRFLFFRNNSDKR